MKIDALCTGRNHRLQGGCCTCHGEHLASSGLVRTACLIQSLLLEVHVFGALQESSLAEAEEALEANKLCGTRQLDWGQVLAEERQRQQQEQQQQEQHLSAATAGASQV